MCLYIHCSRPRTWLLPGCPNPLQQPRKMSAVRMFSELAWSTFLTKISLDSRMCTRMVALDYQNFRKLHSESQYSYSTSQQCHKPSRLMQGMREWNRNDSSTRQRKGRKTNREWMGRAGVSFHFIYAPSCILGLLSNAWFNNCLFILFRSVCCAMVWGQLRTQTASCHYQPR